MRVIYTKNFLKNYSKRIARNLKLEKKFKDRLKLLLVNPENPILKDHRLTGALKYFRSFSVTGDIRVVYRKDANNLYLADIGTHNQVY